MTFKQQNSEVMKRAGGPYFHSKSAEFILLMSESHCTAYVHLNGQFRVPGHSLICDDQVKDGGRILAHLLQSPAKG